MNKYLIGIKVEGALNAYEQTSFQFRGVEITLKFGTRGEGYFNCYAVISRESNVKALNAAKEIVSEFFDVLAFVTSCSFAMLDIFLILKDESGKKERVAFRQISTEKTVPIYIRKDAEAKTIKDLLQLLEKNKDYNLSLHWLRLGYRARTYIEQYSYYWLAFERLLGETQITRNCPECGKIAASYSGVDWNRAREMFSKYESDVDKDYFKKKILKARHIVFHGGRLDAGFYELLAEICPKVQRVTEKILVETYTPSSRVGLKTPNQPHRTHNNNAYYGFTTKTPDQAFARDYPSDEVVEEFHKSALVKDGRNNIELLTFDDYVNEW